MSATLTKQNSTFGHTTTNLASSDSSKTNHSRISNLDVIRAAACTLVLYAHCSGLQFPAHFSAGPYAVSAFCVLSGFLIMGSLLKEQKITGSLDICSFLSKRFFRITAPYIVVTSSTIVVAYVLCSTFHVNTMTASYVLSDATPLLTLTHDWLSPGIFGPLWSITIEEQFYCVVPLMVMFVKRDSLRLALLICAAAFFLPLTSLANDDDLYVNGAFLALIGGCFLAMSNQTSKFKLNSNGSKLTVAFSSLALVTYNIAQGWSPYGVLSIAAFALVVKLALESLWNLPFKNALTHTGKISYCMYLVHMPFIFFWQKALMTLNLPSTEFPLFAMTFSSSFITAHLSWTFFESKLVNWSRKTQFVGRLRGYAVITPALILAGIAFRFLHK